jgi:endonuclease/exonuclease/phosphatase family metal-dependent hydrolase
MTRLLSLLTLTTFISTGVLTVFAGADENRTKIGSYNVYHDRPHYMALPERIKMLKESVHSEGFDILNLQEVPQIRYWADAVRHSKTINWGQTLRSHLSDIDYNYAEFINQGKEFEWVSRFQTAFAVLTRHPMVKAQELVFSRQESAIPTPILIPYIPENRSALLVTVKTPNGPLLVVNTHLTGRENRAIQVKQIRELMEVIKQQRRQMPVVLTGDLNAQPDSETIRMITKDYGFTDAMVVTDTVRPTCCRCIKAGYINSQDVCPVDNPMQDRIDYVFVSLSTSDRPPIIRNAGVFLDQPSYDSNENWLNSSDHIGVKAILEFRQDSGR